jgi:hypothetical protein
MENGKKQGDVSPENDTGKFDFQPIPDFIKVEYDTKSLAAPANEIKDEFIDPIFDLEFPGCTFRQSEYVDATAEDILTAVKTGSGSFVFEQDQVRGLVIKVPKYWRK